MNSPLKEDHALTFSVKGFYSFSRKRKQVEKKIEIKSQKFAHEVLPKKFLSRLFGPSDTWKVFFKQADAFAFVHKVRLNLHVFAFESESFKADTHQGRRMYLVATYPVFWHYYSQLDETHRHHYEIIPEGSVCKLYFDLEFYREFNPGLEDGYGLCQIFIKYVCAWLNEVFSFDCDERNVLVLDASTISKYSEHLIFQLPNAAFKDNLQIGSFVQFISTQLVMWLKESVSLGDKENQTVGPSLTKMIENKTEDGASTNFKDFPKPDLPCSHETSTKYSSRKIFSLFSKEMLQKLIVKDKNGEETLICDLGVYTKNRNFRLFLSQKLGQKNPLVLSGHNKFFSSSASTEENKTIFFHSLIANIENSSNLKLLVFEQEKQIKLRTRNLQLKNPDFPGDEGDASEQSPYPEVDAFISSLVGSNGRRGKIRHWFYFMEGNLLCYDIVGYRWCENIKREHKSNNIRLFVDLKKCAYYQKCHDPICKQTNFCSEYYDLPGNVLPWIEDLSAEEPNNDLITNDCDDDDDDDDKDELEDSLLTVAVENIERSLTESELENDDDDDDMLVSVAEQVDTNRCGDMFRSIASSSIL